MRRGGLLDFRCSCGSAGCAEGRSGKARDALLSGRGRVGSMVVPVVPSPGKPWAVAPRGRPVGYPVRQFLGRPPGCDGGGSCYTESGCQGDGRLEVFDK